MPVFVLNSGTVLSVSGYGYSDSRITYSLVGGGSGVISTDDVDWTTTTKLNNQRGVRLTLHTGHQNQGTPGILTRSCRAAPRSAPEPSERLARLSSQQRLAAQHLYCALRVQPWTRRPELHVQFLCDFSPTDMIRTLMPKVNLAEKFSHISEYWKPYIAAELNGQMREARQDQGRVHLPPSRPRRRTIPRRQRPLPHGISRPP